MSLSANVPVGMAANRVYPVRTDRHPRHQPLEDDPHAPYPYGRELGCLTAIYPNVWMDVGLAVPHISFEIPNLWRQTLGLTPTSKVLFSTDAYSIPEIYWLAARWGRWGLGLVLDELIALGAFMPDEAMAAAEQILHGNAAKVYGIRL